MILSDKINVDIISDVMCPWCLVGYKRFEQAMKELGVEDKFQITWHPFELNPDIANEGEEALALYKKSIENNDLFDIVIMDLTIPGGIGGKEAVKHINNADPDAIVIVTSGYFSDPVIVNYQDYGFKGRLIKPFQMEDLINEIKKVLPEHPIPKL